MKIKAREVRIAKAKEREEERKGMKRERVKKEEKKQE